MPRAIDATIGAEARLCRSRVAHAARRGDPDELADAQRDYWTARLAQHISDILGQAPPLKGAQVRRLIAMLDAAPRATPEPVSLSATRETGS